MLRKGRQRVKAPLLRAPRAPWRWKYTAGCAHPLCTDIWPAMQRPSDVWARGVTVDEKKWHDGGRAAHAAPTHCLQRQARLLTCQSPQSE